jgi:hypothetical protein
VDDVEMAEAVRLFVERAAAVQPGFALTEQTALVVAQICERLDGIPLAIELAATRVRAMSPEQIAARLDQRFRLLTSGSRTALPRQQTLAALVAWSYDLLSEPEQRLFNRLSVFAGGFTLDAAEAMSGHDDALDLLSNLVSKSLVVADGGPGGVERYRLLETLRQYGRERLVAGGDAEEVHQRHAEYYLRLAEELAPQIFDRRQLAALARLDQELRNMRAALRWFRGAGAALAGLRLLVALYFHWYYRGLRTEWRTGMLAFLALPATEDRPTVRARALVRVGEVSLWDVDLATGRTYLEQARALAQQIDDPGVEAVALIRFGEFAAGEEGGAFLEESVRLARRAGEDYGITEALLHHARRAFMLGHPIPARKAVEEALGRARRRGDRRQVAFALEIRGEAISTEQDDAARSDLVESLQLYRELGDQGGLLTVENFLGRLDALQGRYQAARLHYVASLRISKDWGWMARIAQSLDGLVGVAAGQGQTERPLRLAAAAAHLRDLAGIETAPIEQAELDRALTSLRETLAEDAASAASAEGEAMTLMQAVAYALKEDGG